MSIAIMLYIKTNLQSYIICINNVHALNDFDLAYHFHIKKFHEYISKLNMKYTDQKN